MEEHTGQKLTFNCLPSTCSHPTSYVRKYNNDKIIFSRVILQVVFNIKKYLIYLGVINVFL
jgi:hypothetical protein